MGRIYVINIYIITKNSNNIYIYYVDIYPGGGGIVGIYIIIYIYNIYSSIYIIINQTICSLETNGPDSGISAPAMVAPREQQCDSFEHRLSGNDLATL